MKKEKKYGFLIAGAIILIFSIVFALYTYNHSYQASIATGKELSQAKALLKDVKDGIADGDAAYLSVHVDTLTAQKLKQEKPYSYSLAFLFLGLLFTIKGIFNAVVGVHASEKTDIKKLTQAGLLAALCYIAFAFLKLEIPTPLGVLVIHFGNVFCVLAALLIGGFWGGLAGAVGMTIGDLTTAYVTSAPKTFILKLCIGLIVGLVAHKICKLDKDHSAKYVTSVTIIASICGMGFNLVADPVVGYFYKTYLLGIPQDLAAALAKIGAVSTALNAVGAVVFASVFYLALRPAMKKAGLLVQVSPVKVEEAVDEKKADDKKTKEKKAEAKEENK